jgi:Reverse transcriptase (RNA-dependent DNA polymerase)
LLVATAFQVKVAGFTYGSDTPKTFKEVVNQKNQAGWWASMKKEFHAVCLEFVLMSSMPAGRKVAGNRWVLKEKDDGTLRSSTVAQGFSQVPDKALTDSHAPVMMDLAFRLALIIQVLVMLRTGQFDIETAFLISDLDEEIYLRIPEGYVRYMHEKTKRLLILPHMCCY